MKKKIIILFSLALCISIQAQKAGNYLHFNIGSGLTNLSCKLQDGTQKGQAGYSANVAFSHFFTSQWGFQTGIGLQTYSTLSTINYLESTPAIDNDGDAYIFNANFKNWEEKQQASYLDIPLTGQFRHKFNEKFGLLATAGAKISIPVNATYKTISGEMNTSGDYPQWNVEFTDMPQHGFSSITESYTGNYSLKPTYMAIAEIGGLYKLSKKLDLYAGAYLNYGLNNVLSPDSKQIYQVDAVYNGILSSNQAASVKLQLIGVKLGLYLHIGKK